MWWWCLCSGGGLIGCRHGLEHPFDQRGRRGWGRWRPSSRAGRPGPRPAGRRRPGRTGPGAAAAGWTAWKASGWRDLAAVDARGAAGAEQGVQAGSTAGWLRARLRMSAGTAASLVRTARALYRGPLTGTAQALADGEPSPRPMPRCWPPAPRTCPPTSPPRPNRCWWRRPGGWTHPGCGGSSPICGWWPTPTAPTDQAERRHQQRGLWLVADLGGHGRRQRAAGPRGRPDPAGGPGAAGPPRQRRRHPLAVASAGLMPWPSWPAAPWRAGRLPQSRWGPAPAAGDRGPGQPPRPPGGLGGETGGAGPLDPEACRRLACDGAVTRVLVTRHPTTPPTTTRAPTARPGGPAAGGGDPAPPGPWWAPTQPLEVGRTSRVVTAAQRAALVVRDGGCAVAGCDRPPAWCEAHHLRHWLHGGPTDLANLALVCRAHHRAVHEGGWRLTRDPDGRLTATPPHRRPHRAPAAA